MRWLWLITWFLAVSCDVWICRRVLLPLPERKGAAARLLSCTWRALCCALMVVSDLSSPAMSLVGWLLNDNPLWYLRAAMWCDTIYIISLFFRAGFLPFLFVAVKRRSLTAAVCGLVCGSVVVAIPLEGMLCGRKRIEVREVRIRSPRLPDSFSGLRVVQFSDLHIGTMLDAEAELRAVVDTVAALKPDLVIFSGDMITLRYDELDDKAMALLSEMRAPMGVWSFVGNHDVGVYVKDSVWLPPEETRARLLERERQMGWQVVDDGTVWLHRGGDSISLSGVSFQPEFYEMRHDAELPESDLAPVYGEVPDEPFNITVSHLPQLWERIADAGYGDLTLAGHYHGLQLGARFGGVRLSPAPLFHREWSGLYRRDDGRVLYINDGIGYVGVFMRIGTPPEVTLFILEK